MSRVYRCNCGSVAKYNDLCHHGIADGVCCTCALCNEFCVNCGTGDERLLKCFPDRLMCIECIEEEDELRPKVRIHYDVKKTIRVRRAKEPTCENCGKKEKECDVFAYGENITAYNNQMLCPDCIPEEI